MQLSDLQHIHHDHPLFLAFANEVYWRATETDFDPDNLLFLEYQLEQQMLVLGKYGYPIYNTADLNIPYLKSVQVQPWFPTRRSTGDMRELKFHVLMKDIDANVVIRPIFMGFPSFVLEVAMRLRKISPAGVEHWVERHAYSCFDSSYDKHDESDELAETMHKSLNSTAWKFEDGAIAEFEDWIRDSHRQEEECVDEKPYQLTPFNQWKKERQ